jgi:hypothetical protein
MVEIIDAAVQRMADLSLTFGSCHRGDAHTAERYLRNGDVLRKCMDIFHGNLLGSNIVLIITHIGADEKGF